MCVSPRWFVLWSLSSGCVFVDPDEATIVSGDQSAALDSGPADATGGSGTGDDGGDDGSGDSGGDDGGTDDGGSEDGGTEDGGTDGESCTTTIDETYPSSTRADWFYRSPLQVVLSERDETVRIGVVSDDGTIVDGTLEPEDDGKRVLFKPTQPLAPSTGYTLDVSVCSGATGLSIPFETSAIGTPITCSPEGRLYRLSFRDAQYAGPGETTAEQFLSFMSSDLLVFPLGAGRTTIDLAATTSAAAGARQDHCRSTSRYQGAGWNNPGFELSPRTISARLEDIEVRLLQFQFDGAFSPDCDLMMGQMSAQLDVRNMSELLSSGAGSDDPFEMCNFLRSYDIECEDCYFDAQPFCVPIRDALLVGEATSGEELECVGLDACHPRCEASSCRDPADGECSW